MPSAPTPRLRQAPAKRRAWDRRTGRGTRRPPNPLAGIFAHALPDRGSPSRHPRAVLPRLPPPGARQGARQGARRSPPTPRPDKNRRGLAPSIATGSLRPGRPRRYGG